MPIRAVFIGYVGAPLSPISGQDDTHPTAHPTARRPRIPIQASSSTSSDPDSVADDAPNVYINALPPHFTEEQLLVIVANFGEVVSVRTFTRGGPLSSGYGFVLFKSMAAAENRIVTLGATSMSLQSRSPAVYHRLQYQKLVSHLRLLVLTRA
ncbi:hypothetical protein C8F01DRAFT_1264183 [Mycena amicta]|nr:hypothetical protein C8F01DRAFT_1264183 [Mycena amicta]